MSVFKRGLFSVSYAGLWGQKALPLEDVIKKAASLGFDGILVMGKKPHLSPLQTGEAELASIKAALQRWGMHAIGVAAYNDFFLPAPSEVPVEEFQLAYIEACCRVSAELGGALVRIFTGYDHTRGHESILAGQSVGPGFSARWNKLVDLLRRCGDMAAKYGVVLAVQNHHDIAVDSTLMDLLLAEVGHPQVRAGYDAWSPYLRGEDLAEGARLLAPRTALSIAANYRRFPRYQYLPDLVNYKREATDLVKATFMSRGEIDYEAFLGGLADGGYSGWVVYETCSPLIEGSSEEVLDAAGTDFINYMKVLDTKLNRRKA
ncbi:MAG: sugar phosphate isomerase/epimerase family protein [Spirochaetia bacterium]|jgi:sugar phosphate isomerase/epimerase|nr:sugar phosphate isomerase/epimerase family protein [Spirochaetia bacterium]